MTPTRESSSLSTHLALYPRIPTPSQATMSSNLVEVTSPEHFKELLSADLKRVACLNFWAPWAEPCEAFNNEIKNASSKYPSILFLNVSIQLLLASASAMQEFAFETRLIP